MKVVINGKVYDIPRHVALELMPKKVNHTPKKVDEAFCFELSLARYGFFEYYDCFNPSYTNSKPCQDSHEIFKRIIEENCPRRKP